MQPSYKDSSNYITKYQALLDRVYEIISNKFSSLLKTCSAQVQEKQDKNVLLPFLSFPLAAPRLLLPSLLLLLCVIARKRRRRESHPSNPLRRLRAQERLLLFALLRGSLRSNERALPPRGRADPRKRRVLRNPRAIGDSAHDRSLRNGKRVLCLVFLLRIGQEPRFHGSVFAGVRE